MKLKWKPQAKMDLFNRNTRKLAKERNCGTFLFKLLNSALEKGNLVATRMGILRVEGGSSGTVTPFLPFCPKLVCFGVFKILILFIGGRAEVILILKFVDL